MIGFGITLPVLPFYVERLALDAGASPQAVVLHVTLLTSVYALMQLVFAPLWGRWSDRIGRRPLILLGIAGYVVAQALFGLSASLWMLYATRIVGGVLSSATLPVSAAYVVDMTSTEQRSRGMAWLGTAASLGLVVGPSLGGLLSRRDWHLNWSIGHLKLDSFSIPFFAAALLGLLTLTAAWLWLADSRRVAPALATGGSMKATWRTSLRRLAPLLALGFAGQGALAMFEGTFALFASAKFDSGPAEVGYVFVVCGLVMTVAQAGLVGLLAGKVTEMRQVGVGFVLMGAGIALLTTAPSIALVFAFVALLSLGMALIAPNVYALVSKRGGVGNAGASIGVQSAANSLGQAVGPLVAGALFVWQVNAPYLVAGALLLTLATVLGWNAWNRPHDDAPAG